MPQDKSFIEVQFPVSKVSKESFKERKAVQSQTLTGLGKWWGRKPLILVRAAILGLLMPASDDKKRDMEICLKILTMDKMGLLKRRLKSISAKDISEFLTRKEQMQYFQIDNGEPVFKFDKNLTKEEKQRVIDIAWNRMSYDQKLNFCVRPEEIDDRDVEEWRQINAHLGTHANNLHELIDELGKMKYGRRAVIGDCFSGGGSIPFEAARVGCDVYASDLNPIAGLLTWADLNIANSSEAELNGLKEFQRNVYKSVDEQINSWGIETNENGDRANVYLYCTETNCPECGYKLPLASSWVVGVGSMTIANLKDNGLDGFDIEIKSGVTPKELKTAKESATIRNEGIYCPHCQKTTPITSLRKDRRGENGEVEYGLRKWQRNEFVPRETDILRERLYCIRYVREYIDNKGNLKSVRYYVKPSHNDHDREQKVVRLLSERFSDWQEKGYIPNSEIENGDETSRLARERGWKYWHQLFNPRQLLTIGLIQKAVDELSENELQRAIGLLLVHRCCDWNSKLCRWGVGQARESMAQTFYNQAFNTMWEYGTRALPLLEGVYYLDFNNIKFQKWCNTLTKVADARLISNSCDIWITDPPYADAVNYHELSEFFLAWDKKMLKEAFPGWYADSKRVLAVRGRDQTFNNSMIEVYSNLARHMPQDGMQIIMFTHQDVSVWGDLTLIVWSAGLQVTAAWNIATETEASGIKDGNYVKGTVLLVLRKQTNDETAYIDDIYPDIEDEVKRQIKSMQELDDKEEPNFSDADYILAAYAASLKVLTSYKKIEDIDIQYELTKQRKPGELSPIAKLIKSAKKIAFDQLIPLEFDNFIWKYLTAEERLYIKGLELEKHNTYQLSAYQELARGYGVSEYKGFMENAKANTARFKTAEEWGNRNIKDETGFGSSLLRHVFMSIYLAGKDGNVQVGKNWLRNEVEDYWNKRDRICEMIKYISTFEHIANMAHWHNQTTIANILKELVANDGI